VMNAFFILVPSLRKPVSQSPCRANLRWYRMDQDESSDKTLICTIVADRYACPGKGITFSCGATTVPFSKSRAVGARVRLYHWLSVFFVRSDHLTI
jgi:hypothetical protein